MGSHGTQDERGWVADRWILGMFLGAGLLVWAVHAGLMVSLPFQYDFGEGSTLISAVRLREGGPLYPDIQVPPFHVNPYTPVYLWVSSRAMAVLPPFPAGRAVSALSAAAVLALVWWGLRQRGTAALAVAFLVVHPLFLGWSPLFRVDFLGLAFATAGLFAAWRALESGRARDEGAAAVFLTLAFLTKQSILAPFVAAGGSLLLRDPRRGLRFGSLCAALLGGSMGALHLATGGASTRSIFGNNVMPFDPRQLELYLGAYLVTVVGLVALAAYGVRRSGATLWGLLVAASIPIALLSGRAGGFYNYYLELHLGLAVLAAMGASHLVAARRTAKWGRLAILAQLGLGAALSLPPYLHSPCDHLRHETAAVLGGRLPYYYRSAREMEELQGWLDRHPGPVLAENTGNPTVLGRTPWVADPLILFTLAGTGRWNPAPLMEAIGRKEFGLIVIQKLERNNRFPAPVIAWILQNYELAAKVGEDHVLVPRPKEF